MAKQSTIDLVKSLLEGHCYAPLKEASEDWLKKIGTEAEHVAEKNLIPMLKDGVPTVSEMIELFNSEDGVAKVGKDLAAKILTHAKDLEANGEKYCDCDACKKARAILADLGEKLD